MHVCREIIPQKQVTVTVTPNGFADAITTDQNNVEYFVTPYETDMSMAQFLTTLDDKRYSFFLFYLSYVSQVYFPKNFNRFCYGIGAGC